LKKISNISVLLLLGFSISVISCKHKAYSKNRFNTEPAVAITLPYTFKTAKAEHLSVLAFDLRKDKEYNEAIELYRQAITTEPTNPRLYFDLSECYTSTNRLEEAILLLDTAIILDNSSAIFYNNRGLIYWKLNKNQSAINDYKKAIQLDSSKWIIYANLAIAYNADHKSSEACKAFQVAKSLGLNMNDHQSDDYLKILERNCH
jgi:Flp pilus assembly protein TadD